MTKARTGPGHLAGTTFLLADAKRLVRAVEAAGAGLWEWDLADNVINVSAKLAAQLGLAPRSAEISVHAFTMTNVDGEETLMKFKAIPVAGELGLTDGEAAAKGANFLDAELKERLAKGPAAFDLVAVIGQDGDPTDDATALWDEDNRQKKPLGTVTIEAIAPEATCNAFSFLPTNLAEGVAGPANDPIFQIRSPAYAVSFGRRLAPKPNS